MGNFDDTKKKTRAENIAMAIEALEDATFKFAVFVENFKRYIAKSDEE